MSKGKAYVQAGAGIVMDSNPAAEYDETRDKAKALLRALDLGPGGPLTLQNCRMAGLQKGKCEGRPCAFPFCNFDFLQSCN